MGMGLGMGARNQEKTRVGGDPELGPAGQVFQWHLLRGLGVLIRALRLRTLLIELSAVQFKWP